ncbi:recombinase RecT, partial [Rhodopseudomonas sp. B29]|uniref:recombinase RecT n=1 Tax=Rhodopseudomonas sp. B29 TaxID=95607 RepID=UPI000A00554A
MADIARIEDRIDRVAASSLEVSDALGGLRFQNMVEVMEFAKCMAIAETAVPKHLRGNPGMCLAVCIQALEWRFSPFAVANKSYVVNDRIGYESQLVHAVIEQRAPIVGRLRHTFAGEGDTRTCTVTATLRETGETLEYTSPQFAKIQPKNSPLWKTKPDLQLYYNTSRDFCRTYFPDVLLGVYSAEELRDHVGPDNAKPIDKPNVASRLTGAKGRGFNHGHVERESRGGVIEQQPEAQREAGHKPAPSASAGDEPLASEQGASADASGAAQDRCESAAPSLSDLPEQPPADAPAVSDA